MKRKPIPASIGVEGGRRRRLHALEYDEPEQTLAAVRALRAAGFRVQDVHTPFPVHGMSEAMGLEETRIPWATLAGAGLGLAIAVGFQVWSHVVDWPLWIGGKDLLAWPALVPVSFELAVLLAAFATVGALLVTARLWPRPDAPSQPIPGVTDDRFVIVVDEVDGGFAPDRFRALAATTGCRQLHEAWRVL